MNYNNTKIYMELNVKYFRKLEDIDDTESFKRAVSFLPNTGGTIIVPDNPTGYFLSDSIYTGNKKVFWKIGACIINLPKSKHGFILETNGSKLVGSGRGLTFLKHSSIENIFTYPSVNANIVAGSINSLEVVNNSKFLTCPITLISHNNSTDNNSSDAGLISTVTNEEISKIDIFDKGEYYTSSPIISFLGGGAAAIVVDNVQACVISDVTIDYNSVFASVGVYHKGGWWIDVSRINSRYDIITGEKSEHATSVNLLINSYTIGNPGSTGSYGGVYVCNYDNISGQTIGIIGHDVSTATTIKLTSCDFNSRYYHACVGITEINPVGQKDNGSFWDLINVDGLTILGGDIEGMATWYHCVGSCNNLKMINTLAYSATGALVRGKLGTGCFIDCAKTNSSTEPLRTGSLSAGMMFQNTGWQIKHRHGIQFSGDVFVIASSNMKLISENEAILDDTNISGFALTINPYGELKIFYADVAPGAPNPRQLSLVGKWNKTSIDTHIIKIDGKQVLTHQQPSLPNDANDLQSAINLLNSIKNVLKVHGLVEP